MRPRRQAPENVDAKNKFGHRGPPRPMPRAIFALIENNETAAALSFPSSVPGLTLAGRTLRPWGFAGDLARQPRQEALLLIATGVSKIAQ